MAKRVFANKSVGDLLSREFVCLLVNADDLPQDVDALVRKVDGDILPFIAYVTPSGEFLTGTSGFRDVGDLTSDLESVLKNGRLAASPQDETKLARGAAAAQKELDTKHYASARRVATEQLKAPGRSESRTKLRAIIAACDDAGRELLRQSIESAKGDSLDKAMSLAKQVQRDFKGTPLETDAASAVKCIGKLQTAAMEAARGDKPAARHDYQLLMSEAKNSPFAAIAEDKLKALSP